MVVSIPPAACCARGGDQGRATVRAPPSPTTWPTATRRVIAVPLVEARVRHPQRPEHQLRDRGLEGRTGHHLDDPARQPEARVVVRPQRAERQHLGPLGERPDRSGQGIVTLAEVGRHRRRRPIPRCGSSGGAASPRPPRLRRRDGGPAGMTGSAHRGPVVPRSTRIITVVATTIFVIDPATKMVSAWTGSGFSTLVTPKPQAVCRPSAWSPSARPGTTYRRHGGRHDLGQVGIDPDRGATRPRDSPRCLQAFRVRPVRGARRRHRRRCGAPRPGARNRVRRSSRGPSRMRATSPCPAADRRGHADLVTPVPDRAREVRSIGASQLGRAADGLEGRDALGRAAA